MENRKVQVDDEPDDFDEGSDELARQYSDAVMEFILDRYPDGVNRMSMAKAVITVGLTGLLEAFFRDHPDMATEEQALDAGQVAVEVTESCIDMLFGRIARW